MAVFGGTCVLAACIVASPATARDAAPPTAIVSTLPLPGAAAAPASRVNAASSDCLPLPRETADRPDFDSGRQVHLIYLVPGDATDEQLDVVGTLECSFRAQQQWLAQQTDGLEWRLDTFLIDVVVDGQTRTVAAPDITFVESPQPAANLESGGSVRRELEARGFDDPDKRYLTYVESGSGGGACGDALYPLPHVGERWGGQYAQVYLNASEGCGSDDFGVPGAPSHTESIAQQELMHNDGMTPPGAPHGCLLGSPPGIGHVCTVAMPISSLDPERFDVMYPFAGVPLSEKRLDIGHDDYFRHTLPIEDFENTPFLRPVAERPQVPQNASERSIALEASRRRVTRGERVSFSGTVAGPASCTEGVEVVVEWRRRSQDAFAAVAHTTTSSGGTFDVRLRPRRTKVVRAVAPATEGCPEAASNEVVVRVVSG